MRRYWHGFILVRSNLHSITPHFHLTQRWTHILFIYNIRKIKSVLPPEKKIQQQSESPQGRCTVTKSALNLIRESFSFSCSMVLHHWRCYFTYLGVGNSDMDTIWASNDRTFAHDTRFSSIRMVEKSPRWGYHQGIHLQCYQRRKVPK